MRFLIALVSVLALTNPLASVSAQATPAPGCVMPGDLKCGTVCYSPVDHVCANPATSFLCPTAEPSLCGANACYSTSQYTCVNGQLLIGPNATPAPSSAPGCLMPGDAKCGTRCYSPVDQLCVDPATSTLCPIIWPSLCGTLCYTSSQYSCVNGQLVPATSGGTQGPTSGGGATQAPTAAPGCVMPGDEKCGDRCYSPVTHVCANPSTSFLCPVSFPSLCGANACYSTSQYNCVNGSLQPK